MLEESIETRERLGDRQRLAIVRHNHALVRFDAGDLAGAREELEWSVATARDLGDRQGSRQRAVGPRVRLRGDRRPRRSGRASRRGTRRSRHGSGPARSPPRRSTGSPRSSRGAVTRWPPPACGLPRKRPSGVERGAAPGADRRRVDRSIAAARDAADADAWWSSWAAGESLSFEDAVDAARLRGGPQQSFGACDRRRVGRPASRARRACRLGRQWQQNRTPARPAPGRSRGSRTSSGRATTSPTGRSRRRSSSPSSSGARSSSRARPASARRSWRRSSRQTLGARLIRLQCYEGLDVNAAVYEWNYPRQMLEIRLLEARGEASSANAHDIFGPEFLIRRPLLQALEGDADERAAGPAHRRDRPGRRGVRGVPARDPVRLPGDRARDRHDQGRATAAGDPDLEPDPRGPRRAEAPLPVPLDRLPVGPEGVRDRPGPRARRPRSGWPARSSGSSTTSGRPT